MQKPDRETSHFRDRFFIDFSWILDPLLCEKPAKTMEGCSFFMFSRLRLQDRFGTVLGSFWHRFFCNFGSQNLLKTLPKTDQKNHQILNRFFIAFWSIWAPFLGPIWLPNRLFRFTRGAKRGQNGVSNRVPKKAPKMDPKWSQNGSKTTPRDTNFLWFWEGFLNEFGENLVFLFRACAWYSPGSCLVLAW